MKTEKIGYGAGTRDFKGVPNVVRLSIGETPSGEAWTVPTEEIAVLEANLDDMTPQVFGYVMEQALADADLDVFATPEHMKKNRAAILLTVPFSTKDDTGLRRIVFSQI